VTVAVLDACALIAYLHGELGGNIVAGLLTDPDVACYAHAVNLCEVYYQVHRVSDTRTARQVLKTLRTDGVKTRRDMSAAFIERIGELKTRGHISLADCCCIALAQELGGEVVTSEHHEFDRLVLLGLCPIQFIR
jgi:PIN domain nuclease of toxin-antitoxin system